MSSVWKQLEPLLLKVRQPSVYLGNEINAIAKSHSEVDLKFAFAFPDTYEIGMSHLGLQILYGILNEKPNIAAERAFAPWLDMEKTLREHHIPLFSLETHTPLKEFDIIGFSLQHELCYTNVLNMLDLAGIPLKREERNISDPIIIAGGPAVFNPEPLSDFVDIFVIGDGEEKIVELCNEFIKLKNTKINDRYALIKELIKKVECLYAPCLYEVAYHVDGVIASIKPKEKGIPEVIHKAVVENLDDAYYPVKPIVPFAEPIHDRINLEIMRGCPHSCRFCVSSVIKSPLRYRSVERLINLADELYQNTGYDEISLLSLSSGNYPWLPELLTRLNARFKSRGVGISLPSLYIDEQLKLLPDVLHAVRKSGLTIAPETGRDSLRQIIDKPIDDNNLFAAIKSAYQNGWKLIKLYFIIGLPGETEEDIYAISEMINKASNMGREIIGHPGNVNVTISPFTPKPHTPFQWVQMDSLDVLREKQQIIRERVTARGVKLKFHKCERSVLEGMFARGDRKLGQLILNAWQSGCRFDSWDETFDFTRWMQVVEKSGTNPDFYTRRQRAVNEILPWSHISSGVSPEVILKERNDAFEKIVQKECLNPV